eukprot:6477690-Amphidinium_carterae.1
MGYPIAIAMLSVSPSSPQKSTPQDPIFEQKATNKSYDRVVARCGYICLDFYQTAELRGQLPHLVTVRFTANSTTQARPRSESALELEA